MAKKNKEAEQDRRARAAEIVAQQKRAERRRNLLIIGPAALFALALIGYAVYDVVQDNRAESAAEAAAKQPIDGVETFEDLARNHVPGSVDYPQTPPVGGDHNPVWANCGFYEQPVVTEEAVHSMEHGAVWIAYEPDLADADVTILEDLGDRNDYVLVSPVEDMDSPIVLSAWGLQLQVESASDERVAAFVTKYQEGDQTPEPGAACTGGSAGMP